MSILDRYIQKDEKTTCLKSSFMFTGDKGIWQGYLCHIQTAHSGIEKVEFHLGCNQKCQNIIKKYGCDVIPEDGYVIIITENKLEIYSSTKIGLVYGAKRVVSSFSKGEISCGTIFNYPNKKFRALKTYLPARENIDYFYDLVEYCLNYGLNTIMIEVGGAMEYKTHPEINSGWVEYSSRFKEYPGKSVEYQFSTNIPKNSIHWENGGGGVLSQSEVEDIVDYCRQRGINVIPEMPVFSHCDYLLYNHRELAERPDDETPDTYCPSNEGSYRLVCDLLEEIIKVFKPTVINIGHDEVYSVCCCEKCKGKDPAKLFAEDVNFYNKYLKDRGIKTMIWGDKIFNAIGKKGHTWGGAEDFRVNEKGKPTCHIPSMYKAINLLDKDVVVMHWYWFVDRTLENQLEDKFHYVYGNFKGVELPEGERRMGSKVEGFCISNWAECKQILLQRNGIFFHIAYSSMMVWQGDFNYELQKENIYKVADDIFRYVHKNQLEGPYIEIIHSTDEYKNHNEFVDGYFPVMKDEYLGKYLIKTELNEEMEIPVYNNFNVGYSKNTFNFCDHDIYDCLKFDDQLFEPTYTCSYDLYENQVYYKTIIPVTFKGNTINWKFNSENHKKMNIKSVKLIKN